jgi:hypothetical protein
MLRLRALPLLAIAASCIAALPAAANAAPPADLKVLTVANPPASRQAQTSFSIAASVTNTGATRAGTTTTSFWLSRDRARGADLLLKTVATAAIAKNARASAAGTAKATASTPPGTYYVLACADHGRRVREVSETNNCTASLRRITIVRPTITITSPANGTTTAATPKFGFTSNIPVNATCALDGSAPFACANGTTNIITAVSGGHTLAVRAVDAAGNVATATSIWTVDATRPIITRLSGPTSGEIITTAEATWTFSANEEVTYTCRLDDGVRVACGSPYTLTGLTEGLHTLDISGVDAVGNGGLLRPRFRVDLP